MSATTHYITPFVISWLWIDSGGHHTRINRYHCVCILYMSWTTIWRDFVADKCFLIDFIHNDYWTGHLTILYSLHMEVDSVCSQLFTLFLFFGTVQTDGSKLIQSHFSSLKWSSGKLLSTHRRMKVKILTQI